MPLMSAASTRAIPFRSVSFYRPLSLRRRVRAWVMDAAAALAFELRPLILQPVLVRLFEHAACGSSRAAPPAASPAATAATTAQPGSDSCAQSRNRHRSAELGDVGERGGRALAGVPQLDLAHAGRVDQDPACPAAAPSAGWCWCGARCCPRSRTSRVREEVVADQAVDDGALPDARRAEQGAGAARVRGHRAAARATPARCTRRRGPATSGASAADLVDDTAGVLAPDPPCSGR